MSRPQSLVGEAVFVGHWNHWGTGQQGKGPGFSLGPNASQCHQGVLVAVMEEAFHYKGQFLFHLTLGVL